MTDEECCHVVRVESGSKREGKGGRKMDGVQPDH